jgi:hypothetical protein
MEPWLQSATGYIRDWLKFQLRASLDLLHLIIASTSARKAARAASRE